MAEKKGDLIERMAGYAFLGAMLTGLLGLVTAVTCLFREDSSSSPLFVIGAAIAFGLAANAVLRR